MPTCGDPDCAGDPDRFSVSGTARQTWLVPRSPRRARSSRRSLSAVVKLSSLLIYLEPVKARACDNSGLVYLSLDVMPRRRTQQRNRSCVAIPLRRVGLSARARLQKTRHIGLKAFFLQQCSARPEVRLVQGWTIEMHADCLPTIFRHRIRFTSRDSDWRSIPVLNRFELGRKAIEWRGGAEIPFPLPTVFVLSNLVKSLMSNRGHC